MIYSAVTLHHVDTIGLRMERSWNIIVGSLALLKSIDAGECHLTCGGRVAYTMYHAYHPHPVDHFQWTSLYLRVIGGTWS